MKTLLLLILPFLAYADCSINGIWVFPGKSEIRTNSLFVITGYAKSQQIITQLNTRYNAYLFDGAEKVPLVVTETYAGGFQLTQAVLKPQRALLANHSYKLIIENLPESEKVMRYDETNYKTGTAEYLVLDSDDIQAPSFSKDAKEIHKAFVLYGCGPAVYVVFNCPISDQSEYLVKATVKNLKSGAANTFYVSPVKNQLRIGHGMCSGAFTFEQDASYAVSFTIMDASGNTVEWTKKPVPFAVPTLKNSKRDFDE